MRDHGLQERDTLCLPVNRHEKHILIRQQRPGDPYVALDVPGHDQLFLLRRNDVEVLIDALIDAYNWLTPADDDVTMTRILGHGGNPDPTRRSGDDDV